MKIRILGLLIIGCMLLSVTPAHAYNINGRLADWGVNPSSGDWTPNNGIYYTVEDTTSGEYVGPGWGGQKFDAEALYVDWDDNNFYLALVTGFPKTGVTGTDGNGHTYNISAGDIAIDFGLDGVYEYAIEIGGHTAGSTYNGYRGGPGNVFKNVTWALGETFPESSPLNMMKTPAPTLAGSATDFAYNSTWYTKLGNDNPWDDHWVVELSIDRSIFGSDWSNYFNVHWTQTCGNDNINVATPEPMSMSLFGIGALGMLFGRLKKRKA